jgi:hypothetical protein
LETRAAAFFRLAPPPRIHAQDVEAEMNADRLAPFADDDAVNVAARHEARDRMRPTVSRRHRVHDGRHDLFDRRVFTSSIWKPGRQGAPSTFVFE